ncbi:hypothetical protein AYL99_11981 [Fonsecaea erecta]|uniref:Uncharacterized protein n=1 Tax=Fonsecaea erecta TaxID=1367422 RepID=A0A178Z295_9EURO|nr:hypothetical protein AYL99_11981 [Fonsecaea erecta]OAP53824.1 hypothetical protein AYL99_11981 [Fonsecaea erecta]
MPHRFSETTMHLYSLWHGQVTQELGCLCLYTCECSDLHEGHGHTHPNSKSATLCNPRKYTSGHGCWATTTGNPSNLHGINATDGAQSLILTYSMASAGTHIHPCRAPWGTTWTLDDDDDNFEGEVLWWRKEDKIYPILVEIMRGIKAEGRPGLELWIRVTYAG